MRLSDIMSHMNLTAYPIAALVIFLAVFALIARRVLSRRHAGEYARASALPLAEEAPPAPRARREAAVLDHEYDGIREYDNPTPGWWHGIFVLTIIFSVFYIALFHLSPLTPTIHEAWQANQTAEYKKLFGALGELKPDQPTILKMMHDQKMLDVARGIFESNCAACHARDGGGINGVNLCDDHYKNIKQLTDLYATISAGANNGAMPSWRNRLSENERVILAAYVANLRGTTPANPKPPEGEAIAPWPKADAADAAPATDKK